MRLCEQLKRMSKTQSLRVRGKKTKSATMFYFLSMESYDYINPVLLCSCFFSVERASLSSKDARKQIFYLPFDIPIREVVTYLFQQGDIPIPEGVTYLF